MKRLILASLILVFSVSFYGFKYTPPETGKRIDIFGEKHTWSYSKDEVRKIIIDHVRKTQGLKNDIRLDFYIALDTYRINVKSITISYSPLFTVKEEGTPFID